MKKNIVIWKNLISPSSTFDLLLLLLQWVLVRVMKPAASASVSAFSSDVSAHVLSIHALCSRLCAESVFLLSFTALAVWWWNSSVSFNPSFWQNTFIFKMSRCGFIQAKLDLKRKIDVLLGSSLGGVTRTELVLGYGDALWQVCMCTYGNGSPTTTMQTVTVFIWVGEVSTR